MPALEDTADYMRRAITACRRTNAGIGTVMLDREFFSTDVIGTLEELGVGSSGHNDPITWPEKLQVSVMS